VSLGTDVALVYMILDSPVDEPVPEVVIAEPPDIEVVEKFPTTPVYRTLTALELVSVFESRDHPYPKVRGDYAQLWRTYKQVKG
jgi:hypothetical protein